jgi:H+/Cl- antiporter ClcA
VFALEVLAIGRLRLDALLPCMVAAVVADQVGLLWGVQHTPYAVGHVPHITAWLLAAMVVAGAVFGWAGKLFADGTHGLSHVMKKHIAYAPLRL